MFGEGDEVGGLVVMRECVKMRKVIGSRKVYIQGVVLMCFLELLSLKGEGEGVVGAMEREGLSFFPLSFPLLFEFRNTSFYLIFYVFSEVSPEATFTRCLSVLEEVQHEDWIASLLISHIHLRRSNWKEADTILEQVFDKHTLFFVLCSLFFVLCSLFSSDCCFYFRVGKCSK